MTVRGYDLRVDWNQDGVTTGVLEDLTSEVGLSRGRLQNTIAFGHGRDLDQTQAPTAAGTLAFGLNNQDRVLSLENTTSPMAGLVLPGRNATLTYTPAPVLDAFGRTASSGWGISDSGQTWTASGGTSGNYAVGAGVGSHTLASVNASRRTTVDWVWPEVVAAATMFASAVATGAALRGSVMVRGTDVANDHLRAQLNFELSGVLTLSLVQRVGGTDTTLDTIALTATYSAGTRIVVVVEAVRDVLRAKAYLEGGSDPGWLLTGAAAIETTTFVGLRSIAATGNTNSSPVISYDDVSFSTSIALADAVIDQPDPNPDRAAKDVQIRCLDRWGVLGKQPLSTPVYSGLRTGAAVHLILDVVGWPADARDVDPGATVMPWWWGEDVTAADAVEQLVAAEGPPAIAYAEGGTFVFRDRHHRVIRSRSIDVQSTYSHAVPAGSRPGTFKILRGAGYDHGLSRIANVVTAAVQQRRVGATAQVWSTDDTITLTDGETIEIEAQGNDPFQGAITPVDGTDFTTSPGAVEVSLSRTSGQAVTIRLKAVGGPATVAGMALRATPISVVRTVKVAAEDAGSIGTYGRQVWPEEIPWVGVHDARAVADRIVTLYGTNRPVVTMQIVYVPGMPGSEAYLREIMLRRISDRIHLYNDESGLDADFFVERVDHEIYKLGAKHTLTVGCRMAGPEQPSDVFTFDVAGAGFDDGVFGHGGIESPESIFLFDVAGHGFNDGFFAV